MTIRRTGWRSALDEVIYAVMLALIITRGINKCWDVADWIFYSAVYMLCVVHTVLKIMECFEHIELSCKGLRIRWLNFEKFYSWDQIKHIEWLSYENSTLRRLKNRYYPKGGVWFSTKQVDINEDILAHELTYQKPFSRCCICFTPPEEQCLPGIFTRWRPTHLVNREEFLTFIRDINLQIKDIEQAK